MLEELEQKSTNTKDADKLFNDEIQKYIEESPAGQWLLTNYRSYSSIAPTQPGHEFLKIKRKIIGDRVNHSKELLFFYRLNAISKALAIQFKIPFYIGLNEYGERGLKCVDNKYTTPEAKEAIRNDTEKVEILDVKFS